ncbi:hypothetical protein [Micromonospora sp. CPCC 205561]|uniref:hypothetical protein n=1 Tax=Micromonospora sp. CPCC 205561 TaxID=3122407 RepID=UPI002FEF8FB1
MAVPDRPLPHRPGAVSLFFVAKAGVFALGFWLWLLTLVLGGGEVSGAHALAAAGAVTTTLVGVVLGARLTLQRDAADRHAELKRLLVDISWNAFAAAGNADALGKVLPFPAAPPEDGRPGQRVPSRERGGRGDRR